MPRNFTIVCSASSRARTQEPAAARAMRVQSALLDMHHVRQGATKRRLGLQAPRSGARHCRAPRSGLWTAGAAKRRREAAPGIVSPHARDMLPHPLPMCPGFWSPPHESNEQTVFMSCKQEVKYQHATNTIKWRSLLAECGPIRGHSATVPAGK